MSFSDTYKNPADYGRKFNEQSKMTPRPIEDGKNQEACERNAQTIQDAKVKIGGFTESPTRELAAHENWVKFVQEKLLSLED